jgi:deoxyribonuclease (pyrimidine dimer)
MTRINVVPVKELMDQHLLAEVREITRLPKNLSQSLNRKSGPLKDTEIPLEYVLGKGHVKHFLNKFKWLEHRFIALLNECESRGFNITHKDSTIFQNVPSKYYNDWKVTQKALDLNRERIYTRISEKPDFYRYKGKKIGGNDE